MRENLILMHISRPVFLGLMLKTFVVVCFLLSATAAQAATLTVTKIEDTNDGVCNADCSLREAIAAAAASGDEIIFASPLFDAPQIIQLSDAENFKTLLIEKSLTITGKGADLTTVRGPSSGLIKFRVFTIAAGLTVNLNKLKIAGGSVIGDGGGVSTFGSLTTISKCFITDNVAAGATGGGIRNSGNGTLTVIDSTIANNVATFSTGGAGGIHSDGTLNLINSTVSDNTKTGFGTNAGGIWVLGTATITNSTITNNGGGGSSPIGGIYQDLGSVTIRNTIVAANVNVPDVAGSMYISEGYNLIGVADGAPFFNQPGDQTGTGAAPINPRLDPLANYGGTTPTHRLQVSPILSPAIDKGKRFDLVTDQRGSLRPVDNLSTANAPGGDGSDIGAYEAIFSVPVLVTKTADTNDGACDSDCSLREAIAAAGNGNTIQFSALFDTPQTITLSDAAGFQELSNLNKTLNIVGKGANLLTIRRDSAAVANFRIFRFTSISDQVPVNVSLSGMTIKGGRTIVNGGGGIRLDGQQNSLTITNCHITENSVVNLNSNGGGGIQSSGSLTIQNSTISNNTINNSGSITNGGGGIFSISGGGFVLTNSTVSGNVVNGTGGSANAGGIFTTVALITNSTVTDNGTFGAGSAGGIIGDPNTRIRSTIIAGNRSNSTLPDVGGAFVSENFNIVGNVGSVTNFNQVSDQSGTFTAPINPLLSPLAQNGGATPTHALIIGSPAIDAGNTFGIFTDQRGSVRPIDNPGASPARGGDNSDVGAFEAARFTPLVVTKTADTNDGACDADCSLREAIAASVRGREIIFSSIFDSPRTITLTDAANFRELQILDKSLSIAGKGAQLLTIRRDSAATNFRIFRVGSGSGNSISSLNLSGMTVSGGSVINGGGAIRLDGIQNSLIVSNCLITGNTSIVGGGGILNLGSLTIENSTVSNNTVTGGNNNSAGGIYAFGGFVMTNSTVSGNAASGGGTKKAGGINTDFATITNSTVTDNAAIGTNSAGGIFSEGGTTIRSSIVAANRNNSTIPDVAISNVPFDSQGFNFIGNAPSGSGFSDTVNNDRAGDSAFQFDPLLDTLGNYGGTTPTHRPRSNSPTIDRGNSFGFARDQRGATRPVDTNITNPLGGDGSDVGAFEVQIAASLQPPTAVPDSYSTNRNTTLNVAASGVLANDFDSNNSVLNAVKTSEPAHGSVTLNVNGSFTYIPTSNYSGSDSFTYKANNGAADSNVTTVNLTVNAGAATLIVTKIADTNDGVCNADCSLREAIAVALSGDTIAFSPLFDAPQTITLSSNFGTLVINKNLTINGKGSNLLTVKREVGVFRIFNINGSSVLVNLNNLTVSGGDATNFNGGGINANGGVNLTVSNCTISDSVAGNGGGIYVTSDSTLNLLNSTVSGNSAIGTGASAGGIHNEGVLNITNSTVSGNVRISGSNNGGGIWTNNTANISSSTITDNQSNAFGNAGGIFRSGNLGAVTIRNSIVADNRSNDTFADALGAFVSGGFNIIGNAGSATGFPQTGDQIGTSAAIINPRIAPLDYYGGATRTHALFANSTAVNAADPNNELITDQRGIFRTIGGRSDIGAYELNFTFSNSPTGAGGQGTLPNGSAGQNYSVTFSATRSINLSDFQSGNAELIEQTETPNLAPINYTVAAGSLPNGLSLNAVTGEVSGTPTQAGLFSFIIKATDADNSAGAQDYILNVFGPTAATVSIRGRVVTTDGSGLANARVTFTAADGTSRTVLSGTRGAFQFQQIAAGEICIISITSRRYVFQPQILTITEDVTDLIFTAQQRIGEIDILSVTNH